MHNSLKYLLFLALFSFANTISCASSPQPLKKTISNASIVNKELMFAIDDDSIDNDSKENKTYYESYESCDPKNDNPIEFSIESTSKCPLCEQTKQHLMRLVNPHNPSSIKKGWGNDYIVACTIFKGDKLLDDCQSTKWKLAQTNAKEVERFIELMNHGFEPEEKQYKPEEFYQNNVLKILKDFDAQSQKSALLLYATVRTANSSMSTSASTVSTTSK